MFSGKSRKSRARMSLPPSVAAELKDRYLVESDSPLYRCVSSNDQKLKQSAFVTDDYDWGKFKRRSRKSDVPDISKSTPSLYITTYTETVYLSPDDPEHRRNRNISTVPPSGSISRSGLNYLRDGTSLRHVSPSLTRRAPSLGLKSVSPSPTRRSTSLRRSLPKYLPSSSGSSLTLPSYSRSSGIYSDYLDDDQISLHSSTYGSPSIASTRSGSGYGALQRLAPGSPGRSLIPWYLSNLDVDFSKQHHAASEVLQDEMRHDFPRMVDTIGNLDKSVQYYHMLEEQLRLYREDLEYWRSRIDGIDGLTKFKAVNYEGSHKHIHPRHLGDDVEPTSEALSAKIALIEREERQARREREKLLKAKREEEKRREIEEQERRWKEEEEEEERLWMLEQERKEKEAMERAEQKRKEMQKQEEEKQLKIEEDIKRREEEKRKEEEERRRKEEEDEKKRKEEEEERQILEERKKREEQERRRKEDEEKKRKDEEEKKRKEEERKRKEEEEKRKKEEERKQREEEERRILEEKKKREEDERKRKEAEEMKRKEEERKRKEEEERKRKEEEERIRKEEEEERKRKQEEEERKRKEEEERNRKEEEEERKRKEEEETKKKTEQKRKEEERKRKEEEEMKRKEEEEKKRVEEERKQREEEERKIKEEKEKKRKEEERKKKEEEKKRREEKEKMRKEEEERQRKAEEEREMREEEERKRIEDELRQKALIERQKLQKEAEEELEKLEQEVRRTLSQGKRRGKGSLATDEYSCCQFGDYDHRLCLLFPVCNLFSDGIDLELLQEALQNGYGHYFDPVDETLVKSMVDGGNFDHFEDEFDTDDEEANVSEVKRLKMGQLGLVPGSNLSGREETRTVIKGVLDPRTGKEVSIEEAVKLGLIDNSKGLYCNPVTGESVSITQAIADGHIKVEKVKVAKHADKVREMGLMTIKALVDKQRYKIVSVKDADTDKSYDLIQARRLGLIDLKTKEYVYPESKERVSLDEAIEKELVIVEFEDPVEENNNEGFSFDEIETLTYGIDYVVDFKKKSKVPFHQAIERGLVDPESGDFFNNITGERIPLIEAINKGFLKGGIVKDPKSLKNVTRNEVLIKAKGKVKKNFLNPFSVIVAFRKAAKYGMGEGSLQYSTIMTEEGVTEKIVSSEIGLSAATGASMETVGAVEMGVARGEETEIIETEQIVTYDIEEETKTLVKSVLDPVNNIQISIHDAVDFGIVDYNKGLYCNPKTGETISIPEAMVNGQIKVEMVRVTKRDVHTKAIGLITIKSVIEKLHYNIDKVRDPVTGKSYDMMRARHRGILDLRTNQYINNRTKERISLDKAIELELVTVNFDSDDIEPEVVKKTYAINYVVDQKKKIKVPFYEAVQIGLINAETGEYVNNSNGQKVYVGDAIRRGFLKGREVTGEIGLDIDAENKDVTKRISKIRKNVVKSMAVLAAFKRATKHK